MRVAIIHLSDIHFRTSGNRVLERAGHIVSAAASEDPSVQTYVVAISGDIAFSGTREEYDVARKFFEQIRVGLARSGTNTVGVAFVGIPGNHDCCFPDSGTTLRDALISGILPTIHGSAPDRATLDQLLNAVRISELPSKLFRPARLGRKLLENTNAVRLVDVAIKLDHTAGFPEADVSDLHARLMRNAFADSVLRDLVMIHIMKFDVPRPLRQRLTKLFGIKANVPALMDPSRKR